MTANVSTLAIEMSTRIFSALTRGSVVTATVFSGVFICQAKVSLPSVISEVTVYSDRALVTRIAEVSLQPGENVLEIPGLPLGLDDNSLRVNSDNAPGVKLESIEVRPVKPEAKPVDTKRLEDQLQALEDQKNLLRQRLENNSRRSEYLNTLANLVQNLIAPEKENKITAADLRGFLELQAAEDLALRESRLAIEVSLREVENQIAKLREQLQETRRGNPVTTKKVVIVLTAEQEATAPLRISYVMPGASWTPVYDLRSDIENNTVELRYYANVSQTTGEDWNNVMLTLSTARPNIGARMGELIPWRITTQAPPPKNEVEQPVRRARAGLELPRSQTAPDFPASELALEMPDVLEKKVEQAVPMKQSQATVEQHGTAMVFRVPIAATIPSDGRPRRSTIAITRNTVEFRHITTPKLLQAVFIQAKITNGKEALLPGETNLFMGEDFLGKGRLGFVAANAPFEVLLGVDDSVKIRRQETTRTEDITGLLGKRREITRGFRIEATNFRANPIDLIVRDQIPLSGEGDINIRVDWNPRPTRQAEDTGIVEWQLPLKPQEKATLEYRLRIDTSPNNQIYGL